MIDNKRIAGRLAFLLAQDSISHMVSAYNIPNLADNTKEAVESDKEAAKYLGILDLYYLQMSYFEHDVPNMKMFESWRMKPKKDRQ